MDVRDGFVSLMSKLATYAVRTGNGSLYRGRSRKEAAAQMGTHVRLSHMTKKQTGLSEALSSRPAVKGCAPRLYPQMTGGFPCEDLSAGAAVTVVRARAGSACIIGV